MNRSRIEKEDLLCIPNHCISEMKLIECLRSHNLLANISCVKCYDLKSVFHFIVGNIKYALCESKFVEIPLDISVKRISTTYYQVNLVVVGAVVYIYIYVYIYEYLCSYKSQKCTRIS